MNTFTIKSTPNKNLLPKETSPSDQKKYEPMMKTLYSTASKIETKIKINLNKKEMEMNNLPITSTLNNWFTETVLSGKKTI